MLNTSLTPIADSTDKNKPTYTKSVAMATVYSSCELTLRKQRAFNTLQCVIRQQFFLRNPDVDKTMVSEITEEYVEKTGTMFEVPEEQVMRSLGFNDKSKYYSYNQVVQLYEELTRDPIGFDALGIVLSKTEKDRWTGFTRLLGSVERVNGLFRFSVPPKMIYAIINPGLSLEGLKDWSPFKCKYTPGIYDTCLYYHQQSESKTAWFTLIDVMKMTGTLSKSYATYAKFNEKVLSKALIDANNSTELELEIGVETQSIDAGASRGRSPVTHIRFIIGEKQGSRVKKSNHQNDFKLNGFKLELRSLGIAANQIDGVFEECRNEQGNISLDFLEWAIRKGYELRKLTEYKKIETSQFGGLFRKLVIREAKPDWENIRSLFTGYMREELKRGTTDEEVNRKAEEFKQKIKHQIVMDFIGNLREQAFDVFKDDFLTFLETEFPTNYREYLDKKYGDSLVNLTGFGYYHMCLFIDLRFKTLLRFDTYDAYLHEHKVATRIF